MPKLAPCTKLITIGLVVREILAIPRHATKKCRNGELFGGYEDNSTVDGEHARLPQDRETDTKSTL